MRFIIRYTIAQWRLQTFRYLLSALVLALSVALIIKVNSGYNRARTAVDGLSKIAFGDFEFRMGPGVKPDIKERMRRFSLAKAEPKIPDNAIAFLSQNPMVKKSLPLSVCVIEIRNKKFYAGKLGTTVCALNGIDSNEPPFPVSSGEWKTLTDGTAVFIDRAEAERLRVRTGDSIDVVSSFGNSIATVGGILDVPSSIRGMGGIFASPKLFETLAAESFRINSVFIDLADAGKQDAFRSVFESQFLTGETGAHLLSPSDMTPAAKSAVSERSRPLIIIQIAGAVLAALTGAFIVFTTLSMGVAERKRQLGVLRAIGMTRAQGFALAIFEAFSIGLAGWLIGGAGGLALTLIGSSAETGGLGIDHLGIILSLKIGRAHV